MKNRKAVEPPTTYRFQTTWTSGTRDKASGKEALWDRFLSYGYDCHSLTTRVTFRSAVGEKGISAMNETKKKKTEKKERGRRERERGRRGKQSGHSMSQRDCRLTGTPVLSNVAFVAERAFLAATTSLSLCRRSWRRGVTRRDRFCACRCVALRRNKSIPSVSFDFRSRMGK